MTPSPRFHRQVPGDIAEAIKWYEEISSELANRVREALRQTFAKIRSPPNSYGIVFDDVCASEE